MRLVIEVEAGLTERRAKVVIHPEELAAVELSLAYPEGRNRTGRYMRRHPRYPGETVNPNKPVRDQAEPPKVPIPTHLDMLREAGVLADYHWLPPDLQEVDKLWGPQKSLNGDTFWEEPLMLAVPISDLPANLLRPCFHRRGLGHHRLFFLEDEPIDKVARYWCACFFSDPPNLALQWVRFDAATDQALDPDTGAPLLEKGLVWAAALVPLVVAGQPLSAVDIARRNYDLRQILGRQADAQIKYAYEGWFDEWDERVEKVVQEHQSQGRPFADFYHSILALDGQNRLHLLQQEGKLPELAKELAKDGMTAAGLLDSGGSCALFDLWLGSYLNHSWYFREDRGAILLFRLNLNQRLPHPKSKSSWLRRRPAAQQSP